ncbi:MAG TPA: hypothetical protein DCQ34_10290 [Chitinophagaceae bacterium]|nr:hypothetical protein [Chitinophagaceae bacterium]HCY90716.1 hypothetical protein [Chitinophagaceae bacterium]HRF26055.1 hypothetical protein [Ferruginibacter sp.]
MYKARNYVLLAGLLMLGLLFNPLKTTAQLPDPGCDPLDPACPIDGGLSLLIAAGIGIGAKRAYDQKKKNTTRI